MSNLQYSYQVERYKVVIDQSEPYSTKEAAHEALLENWSGLRQEGSWLDEDEDRDGVVWFGCCDDYCAIIEIVK